MSTFCWFSCQNFVLQIIFRPKIAQIDTVSIFTHFDIYHFCATDSRQSAAQGSGRLRIGSGDRRPREGPTPVRDPNVCVTSLKSAVRGSACLFEASPPASFGELFCPGAVPLLSTNTADNATDASLVGLHESTHTSRSHLESPRCPFVFLGWWTLPD